jgi:hypothetical protein
MLTVLAPVSRPPRPAKGVEFLLYPMGDEAAVDVIKALGPSEQLSVLAKGRLSFHVCRPDSAVRQIAPKHYAT